MKRTIKRLAAHVIDQAGAVGIQADALGDDPGISGAEAVIHLRDAQQALNRAKDALQLAVSQRADRPGSVQGHFEEDDAA